MPTTAPPGLLDRDLSKAEARQAIDLAVPLLTEIVNQGLAVLARCFAPPIQGDVHMAVLLPFHHLLEMLDGVQLLVGEAAPSAARPQLRSMLEALLYIEHITETGPDTLQYAIRGYAYLVARTRDALKALRALRRYDAATPEGQDLIARSVVKVDRSIEDIDRNIAHLEARLVKTPWSDVDSSRQALHRSKGPWYCLGTGTPSNLGNLADRLGRSVYYDVLYRDYSGAVHAADTSRQVIAHAPGRVEIRQLRDPDELHNVVCIAVDLALGAIERVLLTYRPQEQRVHKLWYLPESVARVWQLQSVTLEPRAAQPRAHRDGARMNHAPVPARRNRTPTPFPAPARDAWTAPRGARVSD